MTATHRLHYGHISQSIGCDPDDEDDEEMMDSDWVRM